MVRSEMRSRLILPLTACLAGSVPTLSGQDIIRYSHREVRQMMREARNPEDYQKLAAHFRTQQQVFAAKAQSQFEEFARCSRYLIIYPKFTTRADTARQLFSYYNAKTSDMARTAEQYELLANPTARQLPRLDVVIERELVRVRP
jgi:hypothetical protein